MPQIRLLALLTVVALLIVGTSLAGCVNVKAPEQINVGSRPGRRSLDTSSVPPTRSHLEARQKLAEAYDRIRYLEAKIDDLEEDKRELKEDRDDYKRKYKREKDRHDD
jgi:outer membrane murein-binding lipoprotein Lpp